jgi:hypothetical protein
VPVPSTVFTLGFTSGRNEGFMKITRRDLIKVSAATAVLGTLSHEAEAFDDPLPSWNKGPAKEAILTFVKDTTEKSSSKFVEPKDRIATFDQDGTLWTEHPLYTQAMFALDRLGKLAPLMREPKPFFVDDGPGKAIGINMFIGKRPYAAFGNSAGDQQMLEWTQAGNGARLMMLVLHDDATREYAYGPARGLPDTHVGTFSEALLTQANKSGWNVVSMKNDWKRIFAFDK